MIELISPAYILTNYLNGLDVDLYDLNALRTRSLMFVHDLVEALRASGVSIASRVHV